ncbi:MAG: HAD family hydrolase [Atopobiaceae bacterium]|nr:HAD family hydrolase [Atopobiaceae bacterium]
MIRLFASDLDGTLLNVVHDVDRAILGSVAETCEQGCHFVIATCRCMRSNECFGFQDIPVDIACSNGSLIYDAKGTLLDHSRIDQSFLEELLATFPDLPFACIACDHTYVTASERTFQSTNTPPNPLAAVAMRGMRKSRVEHAAGEYVFDATASQVLSHEVCKVNVRVPDAERHHRLEAFLADHADTVTDAPFRPSLFEITNVGVNKGSAVAWLADHLDIPEDEVAVYGDGGNDVTMLERFDHAYVTSCATDEARAAATSVVGSNVLHAVPRHLRRTLRQNAQEQA